jgi:drug/metabolite transporter (DMT)-like permease
VVFASILDVLVFDVEMPIMAWMGIAMTVLAGLLAAQLNERTAQ